MVFACCFGGGGDDGGAVVANGRSQAYGARDSGRIGKPQDFIEVSSGAANKAATTYPSGNTTSLSAVTTADNSGAAYQLQVLNAALAGLSGNWYERVSSAAARLISVSGAVLCSVSILDGAHERFTVVHVTGKDADVSAVTPVGMQLPALQSATPPAHLAAPATGAGLRYNSVQVLQLLQTPLLYSFSNSEHGSQESHQAPHDWQAIHELHGLSEFCALPLTHEKSVVGAVTLVFNTPPQNPRRPGQGLGQGGQQHSAGNTSLLMSCEEGSMRTLGLLLSVLLVGQDFHLVRQIGDVLSGVFEARNLQQVVTVVTAGAEQVLQTTTRVVVSINLAMVTTSPASRQSPTGAASVLPSPLPGGAAGAGQGGSASVTGGSGAVPGAASPTVNVGGGPPAGPASGSGCSGGRAIFFEERSNGGGPGSTQGTNGQRLVVSTGEVYGSNSGYAASNSHLHRSRFQGRSNAPTEVHSTGGQAASMASPQRLRACASGASLPQAHINLRGNAGGVSLSHEGLSGTAGSNGGSGLFWRAGMVQARALSLRHTLLANLPSTGTIVHDCAAYMQQVGCPKRDLYLLSTCQGAPPFSLVIVPAPFKDGNDPPQTQLVLYVAVPMRLPPELLNEILNQAQLLAARVLAPVLQQKLLHGNLSDEWSLLLGCSTGRAGPSTYAAAAAAVGTPGPNGATSNPDRRVSGSALGSLANAAGGKDGKDGRSGSLPSQPGATTVTNTRHNSSAGSSGTSSGDVPAQGANTAGGGGATTQPGTPRSKHPQLPAGLTAAPGHTPETLPFSEGPQKEPAQVPAQDAPGGGRTPQPTGTSQVSHATVLSTAVGGAFAGDTRTHMGMLVSSFKDTINALQAFRAEEAEELSVLKLGKVLGRGGSGLVFQGYLHLGLEVAVKLFENPDDTDPEAISPDDGQVARSSTLDDSTAGGDAGAAAGGDAAPSSNPAGAGRDKDKEGGAGGAKDGQGQGTGTTGTGSNMRSSSKAAAQMTKRQRDLLRNALELGVTSSLSHPNVVQGYCHWVNVVLMQDASLNRCWLMGQAEYMALAPAGSPAPPLCSALVMEYCDMGSLIHAMKRGTFNAQDAKPNMEYIYMCLLEIGLALRHLHTAKLAHCDLKPGNVLLRSSPRDPRGFVCKLGDFGYAAILKDGLLPGRPAVLPDEACGTLQYMAPELFVAGRPVDASIDIYAFGMLMWELITGKTPYSDNEYGSRALMKAVYHGKRPTFPESTLVAYKNLAMCCWSGDPNLRPSSCVLVKLLRQQLESLKQQSVNSSSGPSTGTRT